MIEWKPIKNYEDYLISNDGQVKRNNTILKEWEHNKYHYITLCKNGKKKNFLLHRLVAETFIPNLENLPQVNHKDENPSNNRVDNLEWCSSKYNANYGTRNERNSKKVICLETKQVFNNTYEAGKYVNSSSSAISMCCNRKKIRTVKGLHFCYIDNQLTIKEIEKERFINKKQKVKCIETGKIYNSIISATNLLNIDRSGITACLNGRQKTAGGYHWKRVKEI